MKEEIHTTSAISSKTYLTEQQHSKPFLFYKQAWKCLLSGHAWLVQEEEIRIKHLTFCRYSATLEGTFCALKLWTESVKATANTLLWKSEKYLVAYNKNIH